MDGRLRFVRDAASDRFTMSELCARYGVSRRVGYKWIARYDAEGRRGLVDRSRAPHHCPHAIPPHVAELLVAAREAHPSWGARKLLAVLAAKHPRIAEWPAASTVADVLARRGLVHHRRRRRTSTHPGVVRAASDAPNDLWSADFKGQFRTGDGHECFPLTIADHQTRFLLACHGVLSTQTITARPVFERAFRAYGLPFATQAIHGLSYLNVWWMHLGIVHQRSRPGCPQDNGGHERMHRTFKREAIKPVRHTCRQQQRNFDGFQQEYNTERPHKALGQQTPASRYRHSPRPYPERLPPLEYPGHFLVKKITTGGTFRFQSRLLYLANAMVDQHIGLEETDDGIWVIHFNTVLLATFDERDYIITG
jgi:putative transposase